MLISTDFITICYKIQEKQSFRVGSLSFSHNAMHQMHLHDMHESLDNL